MIVTCPACATSFRTADDRARPGATLRCPNCQHAFAFDDANGGAAAPAAAAPAAGPRPAARHGTMAMGALGAIEPPPSRAAAPASEPVRQREIGLDELGGPPSSSSREIDFSDLDLFGEAPIPNPKKTGNNPAAPSRAAASPTKPGTVIGKTAIARKPAPPPEESGFQLMGNDADRAFGFVEEPKEPEAPFEFDEPALPVSEPKLTEDPLKKLERKFGPRKEEPLGDDPDDFPIGGGAVFDPNAPAKPAPAPQPERKKPLTTSLGVVTLEENPTKAKEENALIESALSASGLNDMSRPVGQAVPLVPRDKRQDAPVVLAEDLPVARGWTATVWSLFVVLLTLVLGLGWIAGKNDGLLDLREFDQMLGVAFRGETYQPRAVRYVRVVDRDGKAVEQVSETPPEQGVVQLETAEVSSGWYRNANGTELLVVQGAVSNQSRSAWRRTAVRVQVTNRSGEILLQRVVPAGAEMNQAILETIRDEKSLVNAVSALEQQVRTLLLEPDQSTRFTAAFLPPEGLARTGLSFTATVVSAERSNAEACWSTVRFDEGGDAPPP